MTCHPSTAAERCVSHVVELYSSTALYIRCRALQLYILYTLQRSTPPLWKKVSDLEEAAQSEGVVARAEVYRVGNRGGIMPS